MVIIAEEEIREKSKNWLDQWFKKHKSYDLIFGPVVTHGKGDLKKILKAELKSSNKLKDNWIKLEPILEGLEIQPDVVALALKNDNLLWFVIECKLGELDVSALAQILLYASVLEAHKAFLTTEGNVKKSVRTLYDNDTISYFGKNENNLKRKLIIGIYSYKSTTDSFEPVLPINSIF